MSTEKKEGDNILKKKPLSPFLKWPGGKRWFVQKHSDLLPGSFTRYIEPFLGGGSVFFHLQPKAAIIGDINTDVIATYKAMKSRWGALEKGLEAHQIQHSDKHFYKTRSEIPNSLVDKAARTIYLNRTCFNGIYRVNMKGEFNVPRGSKDEVILETDNFKEAAKLLKNADIRQSDFEFLIDEANADDLIFADPPYTVRHNLNGFIKYNEVLFSWQDQVRLAAALLRAKKRGAIIVATNANHESVRSLYEGKGFELITTSRFSPISANTKSRRQFEELIILGNRKKDQK